jgi:thiol-disulfide isomerase/thioredoxin
MVGLQVVHSNKPDFTRNMKTKFALAVATAALLSSNLFTSPVFAGDATNELKTLVGKIRTDMAAGKTNKTDLTADLRQFDVLLAEHQGEKTDAVADIVFMKAMLYDQVLHDPAKATELVNQLKIDFQGTEFVAQLEQREAAQMAAQKMKSSLKVGTPFPDFNEKDVDGNPLSIAGYKGKVVLVDFWATWCGPCRAELPAVIATYKKYHDQGFEIIGISLDQDQAKLTGFTKSMNMPWQQNFDGRGWGNKLAVKYGIESIPATYLLDGDGNIIAGDLRGDALGAAVAKALGK